MNIDHRFTLFFRARGVKHLLFWKLVAARGMWIFGIVWVVLVALHWMVWWKPIAPLVLSYVTLLCVQAIVKRQRPNFEKISGYEMWIRTYSFPSGHSTESAAFALSLLLFPMYPSVVAFIVFAIFLGGLALFVMYSRIAVGVHYFSDVIAGALLGTLYALAFFFA